MDTMLGILFLMMFVFFAAFIVPWFVTYVIELLNIVIDHFRYN